MTAIEQKQSQFQKISIPCKRFVQHSISGHWKISCSISSIFTSSRVHPILLCQMIKLHFEALGGGLAPLFEWRGLKQPLGLPENLGGKMMFPENPGIVASCSVGVGRLVADCDSSVFEGRVIRLQVVHFVHLDIVGNINWTFTRVYMDIYSHIDITC